MNRIPALLIASFLLLPSCGKGNSKPAEARKSVPAQAGPAKTAEDCGVGLDIAPSAAVATIDGVAVPCSELFERTSKLAITSQAEFREQLRGLHQQGLSELIDEKLLNAAADEKKQSVEEFVSGTLSIQPTTPEEAKAFYEKALAQGEQLPPYDEIQEELVAFINENKQKTELSKFRAELRAKASVELSLPTVLPPKVLVDGTGPAQGAESAKVTIVEFSDYQCHFCGKSEPTVHKLLEEYGDKIRLVYRDYPLPNHTDAPKAAEAAHCAGKEGKFWEMHDALFANSGALGVADIKRYAVTLGLDSEQFAGCLDSGEMKPIVIASMEEGQKVGVNGTPAFFVNGRILSGAQPFERFKEVIDHELGQP
ncbi:MAG: DsbA family protein [Myxococcales bacterium]|nr:DsbA family protein [Myxococcales bacterium]